VSSVDLLVRGGTVVTPGGSFPADLAVQGGRISAIEPDLSGLAASAREVVDASGLLVLPGAVDVHTHTRVASDAEPDRFFQDSVAAAFGGTTTFLAFNNPGTGTSAAAERSLVAGLSEWRATTASDAAVDYAVSLAISGRMDDPVGELAGAMQPLGVRHSYFDPGRDTPGEVADDDRRLVALRQACCELDAFGVLEAIREQARGHVLCALGWMHGQAQIENLVNAAVDVRQVDRDVVHRRGESHASRTW